MRVQIQGHGHARMAKHLGDDLRRHALEQQQSGGGVPQIMHPQAWQMRFVRYPVEGVEDIGIIPWRADLRREDEVEVIPRSAKPLAVFRMARLTRFQACCGVTCELDAPPSSIR